MDLGLKGKKAFITGGSHGIGLAIAAALIQEGCAVSICSRSAQRLDEAQKILKKTSPQAKIHTYVCDVLDKTQIDATIAAILNDNGAPDILINNVGGGGRWGQEDPTQTDPNVWAEVYQKNAGAAIQFTTAFLPTMQENNWGRVVTITSRIGREGGGRPWFAMAKAAQMAMMKSLSKLSLFTHKNITFNTVAPGNILIEDTGWDEMRKNDPAKFQKIMAETSPLGRPGTPEEVAFGVVVLCANQASLLNGVCLAADGGESHAY